MNHLRMFAPKLLPLLTSIGIIIVVAFLREKSRTLAVLVSTIPLNITLVVWLVASVPGTEPRQIAEFVRILYISLIPALIWLGIVFFAVRAGWSLLAAFGAGYAVWAFLIGGLLLFGVVVVPQ